MTEQDELQTHTISVRSADMNNPIGKLQEMHIIGDENRGAPPFYDLIDTSGDDHGPTFTMQATFKGQTATGQGGSKKIAKTIAATNLLRKLLGEEVANSTISLNIAEVSTTGNMVGELQEFCSMKGLYPPWYEEVSALGPAHNKNFALTCSIGRVISERGTGPSKKTAKREAAAKVLSKLKSMSQEQLKQFEDPEVQERRRRNEEEFRREEEERERLAQEDPGEQTMGTWGEEEGEGATTSFSKPSTDKEPPSAQNAPLEVGGWGSGEAMYEGEVGVWGTGDDASTTSDVNKTTDMVAKTKLDDTSG